MPYINLKHSPDANLYVHVVWSTKNRYPFLKTPELRKAVWQHIQENAAKKEINIIAINGHEDHCHCLIIMRPEHSLRRIMQLIKGESSHWINQENLCKGNFRWQDSYHAQSVEKEGLDALYNYIHRQEDHHRKITFQDIVQQMGLKPNEV